MTSIISRLFYFRQPMLTQLDHLPIVIHDKMLLLLIWKSRREYKIAIANTKRAYYGKEAAIIVQLASDAEFVRVHVSSFWRKRSYSLPIKKITLSDEARDMLIHQLFPMLLPNWNRKDIRLKAIAGKVKTVYSEYTRPALKLKSRAIHINQYCFDYYHQNL